MAQSVTQSRCARCSQTWRKPVAPRRRASFKAAALQGGGSDDIAIGGLQTVYCDDFQCDSSPQVERAVRSFAKDIERKTSWTITIFAENVRYQVRTYIPRIKHCTSVPTRVSVSNLHKTSNHCTDETC